MFTKQLYIVCAVDSVHVKKICSQNNPIYYVLLNSVHVKKKCSQSNRIYYKYEKHFPKM